MKNSLRSHACNNKVYGRWDEDTMDREISMLKIFVCIINSLYYLIVVTEHTNKAEMYIQQRFELLSALPNHFSDCFGSYSRRQQSSRI